MVFFCVCVKDHLIQACEVYVLESDYNEKGGGRRGLR